MNTRKIKVSCSMGTATLMEDAVIFRQMSDLITR